MVYTIDIFGPRAVNSFMNISWAATHEQAEMVRVEIVGEIANLTWTQPQKSSKTGKEVFPGEGFWFVRDHSNMIRALEYWQQWVKEMNGHSNISV